MIISELRTSSSIGGAIGGVVGAVIFMIITALAIVLAVLIAMRRREDKSRSRRQGIAAAYTIFNNYCKHH